MIMSLQVKCPEKESSELRLVAVMSKKLAVNGQGHCPSIWNNILKVNAHLRLYPVRLHVV
jgi:hypothetical protein